MNQRATATAATAASAPARTAAVPPLIAPTQKQTDAVKIAEAQANLQKALDAMARLRETIDRRPGHLFPDI